MKGSVSPRSRPLPLLPVAVVCGLACALLFGCSGRPARIDTPDYDPAAIAAAALAEHDRNEDGLLDGDERSSAFAYADANADGQVTAAEIEARVEKWIASKIGLQSCLVTVTRRGRPLSQADVQFEPESCMAGRISAAQGRTSDRGMAQLRSQELSVDGWPEGRSLPGLRSGFYKVRITHPTEAIPAKYNTDTILGAEIAPETVIAGISFDID